MIKKEKKMKKQRKNNNYKKYMYIKTYRGFSNIKLAG